MTRATYNTDNTITELPGMMRPEDWHYWHDEEYKEKLAEYTAHLATLRTIVCSPECRGLWKVGQEYVEGKDYEVREEPIPYFDHIDDPVEYRTRAYPIVPVKSEDNWLTTKPTFTEECILITASKVKDKWHYNFWLIEKLDDMEDGWYWGVLCPDGDEWGDLADLQADKYLVIPKLKP